MKKPKYEITEVKLEEESFAKYVTGKLKNNTDSKKTYIQVTFPLYDKDGAKVGTAFDNVNDLEPGATWKFKAIVLEKDFDKVDFDKVEATGF